MAHIARADGTIEPIDAPVSLERAQEVVGGYVERFICFDLVLLWNEDARFEVMPINKEISELVGKPILGDVIVLESGEAEGWL